jgi:hypothetical protein
LSVLFSGARYILDPNNSVMYFFNENNIDPSHMTLRLLEATRA